LYHGYSIILYFPESFYQLIITLIVATVYLQVKKRQKRVTFFEKLERIGVKIPAEYKKHVDVPIKCPNCNAMILSNAEFCWKCGKKIVLG